MPPPSPRAKPAHPSSRRGRRPYGRPRHNCSGGNLSFGGGNSYQKKYGIEDSPDRAVPGSDRLDRGRAQRRATLPLQRSRDRPRLRRQCGRDLRFLLAHGVKVVDQAPDNLSGHEIGMSAPRTLHCAAMDWPLVQTGKPAEPDVRATTSSGNGLMQPLLAAAEQAGVKFLLRHRMTAIHRGRTFRPRHRHRGRPRRRGAQHPARRRPSSSPPAARRETSISAACSTRGSPTNIRSRRHAVVRSGRQRGTRRDGGRRFVLGIDQLRRRVRHRRTKPGSIGCQYGYANLRWFPGSTVFDKARAIGLKVADWQNVILVNMLGRRFYDETGRQFTPQPLRQFRALPAGRFPQREGHQVRSHQFHQCRARRHRRRPQRRRADLGDLRQRRGRARGLGSGTAPRRCRRRLLFQRRHASNSLPPRSS